MKLEGEGFARSPDGSSVSVSDDRFSRRQDGLGLDGGVDHSFGSLVARNTLGGLAPASAVGPGGGGGGGGGAASSNVHGLNVAGVISDRVTVSLSCNE